MHRWLVGLGALVFAFTQQCTMLILLELPAHHCMYGHVWLEAGFTLPTVKRFSPTSGIGKPAVNRRKPLETARNDNSNSKTGNRCLPTGNRCLPTGNRRF